MALYWLLTGGEGRLGDIAVNTAIGAFLPLTSPWVIRALVALRAALACGLLTNQTAALRAGAEQFAASRRAAVHAEAHTPRRVERDIHDAHNSASSA